MYLGEVVNDLGNAQIMSPLILQAKDGSSNSKEQARPHIPAEPMAEPCSAARSASFYAARRCTTWEYPLLELAA
jgi:hypothetical protein